jgi:hypothetical protein
MPYFERLYDTIRQYAKQAVERHSLLTLLVFLLVAFDFRGYDNGEEKHEFQRT